MHPADKGDCLNCLRQPPFLLFFNAFGVKVYRAQGNNGGDCMFVDELLFIVTVHDHGKVVKTPDEALDLKAIEQENRHESSILTNLI